MPQFAKIKSAVLLVILGSLSWSLTMVKSGIIYPFGMGFWGPNGHDGIWHIAVINHLAQGSLEMPVYSGSPIRNYHIGFDLLLAWLHNLTQIPITVLYFQIFPPLLAGLIGVLTYKFVLLWRKSPVQAFWATFFVYFAGDFGWILTFLRGDGFGGESLFWAQQAISTLVNPPYAASLVLLLGGAILLLKLQEKFTIHNSIFAILIFGILVEIKFYAGALGLFALGIVGIVRLIKNKDPKFILICAAAAAIAWISFLPLGGLSKGLVVFQPFWFLETMMAVSDRVGWQRFYDALMNYKNGNVFFKLIPAYIVAFLIFFVGNLGMRIVGILGVVKNKAWNNIREIDIFLLTIALTGTILPMFILQSGTPWNTIQFFYYSLFIFAIYTGLWVGEQMEHPNTLVYWGIGVILLLTIPTTISTLMLSYIPGRPPAKISNEELEALSFLEKQPDGVVFTYPFDRYKAEAAINNPPRPLYLYESSAYVSAFSGKTTYLEDEVNLDITGYQWRDRREKSKIPLESLNQQEVQTFLKENKIKYLYLVLSQTPVFGQRFRLGETQLGLTNILENKEVVIYKVD